MLTPPPCFRGLVDCEDGYYGSSGGSSGGSTSGSSDGSTAGSTSRSSGGPSGGSGNGSNGTSGIFSSRTPLFGSTSSATRFLSYTASVTNRGTQALRGLMVSHGSIPPGATFDFAGSASSCSQAGSFIRCITDLLPGETKSFLLRYTVSKAQSCALNRSLLSAKTTSATGAAVSGVSSSVSCTVVTDKNGTTGTNGTSSTNGASSGTGNPVYGSSTGSVIGSTNGVTNGYKTGYKPSMPRTGALSAYIAADTSYGSLTPYIPHSTGISWSTGIVPFASFLVLLWSFYLIRKRYLAF